jgi:hypothetical protein
LVNQKNNSIHLVLASFTEFPSMAKRVYNIIETLGLKYDGRRCARPSFPKESLVWQFWRQVGKIALKGKANSKWRLDVIDLASEYGPQIWGDGEEYPYLVEPGTYLEYPERLIYVLHHIEYVQTLRGQRLNLLKVA